MKNTLAFFGLILILISTHLFVYEHGRIDGVYNYKHGKSMMMTLGSMYHFGLIDGEETGFMHGYLKGEEDCKTNFLKLSHREKRKWCK